MVVFITALIESLVHFKKNWRLLPLAALFDFLFFFCFGIATTVFQFQAANHIQSLLESGNRLAAELSQVTAGQSPFDIFLSDPTVAFNARSIVFAFLFLVVLLYGLWILFGGATWYLSYKMTGERGLLRNISFITKFSLVSAVWFAVYTLFLAGLMRFIGVSLLRPDQLLSSDVILTGVSVINYVILYFVFFSLSLSPYTSMKNNFKMTFTKGFTRILTLVPMYAIIAGAFYLNFKITFLIFQSFTGTITAAYVVAFIRFILAAPFLVWARLYGMLVAKKIIDQHSHL